MHIALMIWLIFVPYKRRREMDYLDNEYTANKYIQLVTSQSQFGSQQHSGCRRSSLVCNTLPRIKSERSMRHSVGVMMIPNVASFPIQEDTNETIRKAMSMVELREQDDEYYDNEQESTL
jgi:hypothetical protein